MKCEYNNCDKKAIVRIFHTTYCIKHAIEVLVSLFFLYDDKYYDKAFKIIKIVLNEKKALSAYAIAEKANVPYYSVRKILQQLAYVGLIEEVKGLWQIRKEQKYLGLINTNG